MDSDLPENFQKELTCAICLNYFIDPVTMGCGHSCCCSCLCVSWEKAESPTCPVCREPSEQKNFKTNIVLKNLVSMARKASLWQFLSSEDNRCGLHKEAKQIFCEDNRSLLCLHCSSSQEHEAHRHCSVEEAVEEHRRKLSNQMRSLWEKIQEIQKNLSKDGRIPVYWMTYLYRRQDETRAFYETLQLVLHEKDKQNLEILIKEGSKLSGQLEKRQAEMIEKRISLRAMHDELMDMCLKPDVEMLKELGDKLRRSEQVQLHMPQPLQPEFPARPITRLMRRLNRFRVEVSFTGEITHDNIRLFDDVRSLRFMRDGPHVSLDPGASNCFAAWGAQVFNSGRHYWEVNVDKSWDWAVGVCRDSCMKKNGTLTESKDTFLLIHVKEDNHTTLWTTAPMAPQYIQKPLGRVGVFLDIDNGSVNYYYIGHYLSTWIQDPYSVIKENSQDAVEISKQLFVGGGYGRGKQWIV
ncbi:Tripartite motif-containing protein 43 [Myotis brandtii]|uniref:Tripartite motif-containing protein 43 n=1 Tax=Myotis brandtii TaxID=109478 RepID=S7PFS1_MYOBR|nr:Tripartite motif-containing protein 43 [Myotis brandtii]